MIVRLRVGVSSLTSERSFLHIGRLVCHKLHHDDAIPTPSQGHSLHWMYNTKLLNDRLPKDMLIMAHLIVNGPPTTVRQCWIRKETYSERKTFLGKGPKTLEWKYWSRSWFKLWDHILAGDVKALEGPPDLYVFSS